MIVDADSVAAVLAPIDGGVGADGRTTEDEALAMRFRELRAQRKAIFRAEQKAAMGSDPGEADGWSWDELGEQARAYLIEDGKDLEPAAMLIEASARVDGLPGLDIAMALAADLVVGFWEQGLYPPDDEDDGVEARFQPLSSLSGGTNDKEGTLILPLRRIELAGSGDGALRYIDRVAAETQFASAQRAGPDAREAQVKLAEAALAELEARALAQPASAIRGAIGHLQSAEAHWRRAVDFIIQRTKPLMPAASRVTEELRRMREWLETLLKKMPEDAVPEESAPDRPAGDGGPAVPATANGVFTIGRIDRRDDALRAVAAAADYFERLEPLSPLGATLREVDRRARLTMYDMLAELIPDERARQDYLWRAGIRPPAEAQ